MKTLILVLSILITGNLSANDLQGCTSSVSGLGKNSFGTMAKQNINKLEKLYMSNYVSEPYLEVFLDKASMVADTLNAKQNKSGYKYDSGKIKDAIKNYNSSSDVSSAYRDLDNYYAHSCANKLAELAIMKLTTNYNCDNTKCELQNWVNNKGEEAKAFYEKVKKMYIRGKVKYNLKGDYRGEASPSNVYCVISAKDIMKAFTGVVAKYDATLFNEVIPLRQGKRNDTQLRDLPKASETEVEQYATGRTYNSGNSKLYLNDGTALDLPIKFEIQIGSGYKVIEKASGSNKVIFDLENGTERDAFAKETKVSQFGCMYLFRVKDRDKAANSWSWYYRLATLPLTGAEYNQSNSCQDFLSKAGYNSYGVSSTIPGNLPSIRYYTTRLNDADEPTVLVDKDTKLCSKK